jgi:hypothetical protein|uniref:DUF3568 family protein n=1 Tax=Desulfobacca acetoxidans TaxID=60893 RepID=A0A7C5AL48_9BACT
MPGRKLIFGGVILSLFLTSGCALALLGVGAAAGIGAYTWVEGTMEKDYPRVMQPTFQACVAACRDMQLTIKKEAYHPLNSVILATTPDGTNVDIQLVARPNDITTVKVRFGFMGNKDNSAYFHRNVMRHLGIKGS